MRDKQQLVEELRQAVGCRGVLRQHGVSLAEIERTTAGSLERLTQIVDAVECLISPDPLRKDFLAHERLVSTLFQAVKPDPAVLEFAARVACLTTIAETIRERTAKARRTSPP